MKSFIHRKKDTEQTLEYFQQTQLKEEIQQLLSEMNAVQKRFENETDFELIEAHIWEMRALEIRYQRALHLAKAMQSS